jgi:hypothetical protein
MGSTRANPTALLGFHAAGVGKNDAMGLLRIRSPLAPLGSRKFSRDGKLSPKSAHKQNSSRSYIRTLEHLQICQ